MSVDRPDAGPPEDPAYALDLAAASGRADRVDTQAMLEALAARLEEAIPRSATVKRRRAGGLFSKRTEVERIAVDLGELRFELEHSGVNVACARAKVVRGIALRRDELPIERWIAELVEEVVRSAEVSDQTRRALEGLVL